MASFFGKIFFFCLNTKLSGIKNCPKKKFCKSDNFVIFENIDENVPSSSLCDVLLCSTLKKRTPCGLPMGRKTMKTLPKIQLGAKRLGYKYDTNLPIALHCKCLSLKSTDFLHLNTRQT